MKKIKVIALLLALAAMSFGCAFMAANWMNPKKGPASAQGPAGEGENGATTLPALAPLSAKEKQLDDLVSDVKGLQETLRKRQAELDQHEKRLAVAQEMLKKQVEDIDNLRMQLVAPLTALKEAQAQLQRTRVAIVSSETVNLKKTAAMYEKMDASAGGRIIEGMRTSNQIDDAVKMLHYMSDRGAAKLMSELGDKALAARLTEGLKRVKEES